MFNSYGDFQEHECYIYPSSLILNKENVDDNEQLIFEI